MVLIRTYNEAKAYILKGRNKTDRPLGNNGRIYLRSDTFIEVRLHDTSIIQYYKNKSGDQTMSVDGWYDSMTTRRRIEDISGMRVTFFAGVPILGNRDYLMRDSENATSWVWAGDGRYGADHSPLYIADQKTRIRTDGSIVHEGRARKRLDDHCRARSAKAQRRINAAVERTAEAEWNITKWLSQHAKSCKEKLAELAKLEKEIGYLEAKKEKSLEADEGLPGVHNRI